MLDEMMAQGNTAKFAIFFVKNHQENALEGQKHKLLYISCGISYSKNVANFVAFRCNISSSIKLLFLKSVLLTSHVLHTT